MRWSLPWDLLVYLLPESNRLYSNHNPSLEKFFSCFFFIGIVWQNDCVWLRTWATGQSTVALKKKTLIKTRNWLETQQMLLIFYLLTIQTLKVKNYNIYIMHIIDNDCHNFHHPTHPPLNYLCMVKLKISTVCLKKTPLKEMCDFLTLKMLPLGTFLGLQNHTSP